ncbi:MAG: nitroreductase family protein [archaeon]
MDTFEAIRTRRSIRSYLPKKIPDEVLFAILDAGHHAPAAWNFTNWRFLVVETEEKKKVIAKAALRQEWIAKAPVVLIVCSEPGALVREGGERAKKLFQIQNVAAAVENMLLAAHDFRVASCWVGAFTEPLLRKEFQIHDDAEIHAIIPLGYSNERPKTPSRPAFSEVTFFERWENQDRVVTAPSPLARSKTLGEHLEERKNSISKKIKSAAGKLRKKK